MRKNIVIHNKQYSLSLDHEMIGKTSGICYRLVEDGIDLAVKLYYSSLEEEKIYPSLLELNQFCAICDRVFPVLVSKAPVFDEFGNYIGCSMPFIHEMFGITKEILYQEPLDFVLEGLSRFQNTLSVFSQNKICVFDWRVSNMKIGWVKDLGFGMFLYDDSYYSLSDLPTKELEKENQRVFNHLIASMIVDYYLSQDIEVSSSKEESKKRWAFCDQFDLEFPLSALSLLEKEASGFLTFGDYLDEVKNRGYCIKVKK